MAHSTRTTVQLAPDDVRKLEEILESAPLAPKHRVVRAALRLGLRELLAEANRAPAPPERAARALWKREGPTVAMVPAWQVSTPGALPLQPPGILP